MYVSKLFFPNFIQTSLYLIRSHEHQNSESLRIKCDKCNMVVIVLELMSLSHTLIYVRARLARVDQVVAWIHQSYSQ